jgi:hypothetical protein
MTYSKRACRKLWHRPHDGLCRPRFHALSTCGSPKQSVPFSPTCGRSISSKLRKPSGKNPRLAFALEGIGEVAFLLSGGAFLRHHMGQRIETVLGPQYGRVDWLVARVLRLLMHPVRRCRSIHQAGHTARRCRGAERLVTLQILPSCCLVHPFSIQTRRDFRLVPSPRSGIPIRYTAYEGAGRIIWRLARDRSCPARPGVQR